MYTVQVKYTLSPYRRQQHITAGFIWYTKESSMLPAVHKQKEKLAEVFRQLLRMS